MKWNLQFEHVGFPTEIYSKSSLSLVVTAVTRTNTLAFRAVV